MAKRGLGKGLDALFPENVDNAIPVKITAPVNSGKMKELSVPLAKLKANPDQPRKNFNNDELNELADSIRAHGVIQPIIVEEGADGVFIIVAGERRTRAAKIAGLKEIPAIVRNYSGQKRMIVSLIENIQRANLNPIEEAAAYKRLMDAAKLSQDEAAAQLGKNRSTVANALRLLKLSPEIQKSLAEGELTSGHARAILSIHGVKNQNLLYQEIIKKKLSVREAEKRALFYNEGGNLKDKPKARSPELADMEDKFIKRLGTKVKISGDENKGTINIEYFSMDDLDRLYDIIGG